jgi:hypothetical protein
VITWELADRLIFERGIEIPVKEPHEYEDRRLYEIAKELHELYVKQAWLWSEITVRACADKERVA